MNHDSISHNKATESNTKLHGKQVTSPEIATPGSWVDPETPKGNLRQAVFSLFKASRLLLPLQEELANEIDDLSVIAEGLLARVESTPCVDLAA